MAHSKYGIEVQRFYNSSEWKKARQQCIIRCKGRCQRCGRMGKEVHHKIPLTDQNVHIYSIALDQSNLELLCTRCHNRERENEKENGKDYSSFFDENGEFIILRKD